MMGPIETDRKQLTDTIAEECIAVRMRMLNRVVTNIFDEALRPLGLKVSQLNVLVATARMGIARPAEISDRLKLFRHVNTQPNVERMIAKEWLEVVPDEDGRAQPFRLTASGSRLLESAKPKWEQAQIETAQLLGESFTSEVGNAVTRMRNPAAR